MNEVETLRTLLSEQIKRNADLHVIIARAEDAVKEARRDRDAAWDALRVLKAKQKEEAKWGWVLPNGCFVKEEAK